MTRISRRRFLEDSLAAATAALASAALPPPTRAEDAPRRAAGPNDQVRIACIGLHGRGMAHVGGYLGIPGVTVAALCDVDENVLPRAVKAVETAGQKTPETYQDLRKLYENKEIDAVSVALPIHWAALASIWAMQAGKDVYCEKPVSHNVSEGRRSAQAARKYRRICQAGTQSRSHKACRDAIDYIHSGKIGKVTLARGLCYKPRGSIGIKPDGPVPAGVDYDIWLGAAPKRPYNPNRFHYNWHWNWDYGTGDLGNQGIHQMDIARWALDKNELPSAVLGLGGRFGYVDQGETPNTMICSFDYGDKHLLFEVRGLKTDPFESIRIGDLIYGSDGYVAFTDNYGRAAVFDNDHKQVEIFTGAGNHFKNFVEAVRSRDSSHLNAPVEGGHLSSALCHLGNVSYRLGRQAPFDDPETPFGDREADATYARFTSHLAENGIDLKSAADRVGRPLKFDSRTERFVNDDEANEYLTRPYREPFVVPARL